MCLCVCLSFHCHMYPYPDKEADRQETLSGLLTQIEDLTSVRWGRVGLCLSHECIGLAVLFLKDP